MHRDYDYGPSDHVHDHSHDDERRHDHASLGHNHPHKPRGAAQWQTLHPDPHEAPADAQGETDLDHVEAAFIEGFLTASDPTSFLRLAGIPFKATASDGATLLLLRVETEVVVDMGSLTPHLGGGSFRHDPLPAPLVSRRRRLRLVYFDGRELRALPFASVRKGCAKDALSD